ncbi:MAG: hypothetical protein RMY16_27945 [Nostoc sp. DedQUE12b]|uniref:hypothetical protein n=1 Tax=Nostoc sp. DedQUE12b TaxID=3075398 RepID=UPI002AD3E741|nr:hypothetical protein [Nostoc sp. DedQUE12b]MDZ8089353.1 hypothetical protein [Nostoc sp. DedQUE12b]
MAAIALHRRFQQHSLLDEIFLGWLILPLKQTQNCTMSKIENLAKKDLMPIDFM